MNLVSEMESVLREEQELLLAGQIEALEPLVARKAKLVEVLASQKPAIPEEELRRLIDRANHNESLLNSAQQGVQAAIAHIRQTAEAHSQNTYSRTGERRPLSGSPASVTQRS